MKIRNDFVTNSSSSSFIIGKKDDISVTIESVYNTVRALYFDYIEKSKCVLDAVKDDSRIEINNWGDLGKTLSIKGDLPWDEEEEICQKLEKEFNVDFYDNFIDSCDWISCKTYEEYKDYWRAKSDYHAPFSIVDFLEEKFVYYPHELEGGVNYIDSRASVLDWYYPYANQAFKRLSSPEHCKSTECSQYCCKELCDETLERIREVRPPQEKACLYLLGRIAILSEDCYIPDPICDSLAKLSEHYCKHMG